MTKNEYGVYLDYQTEVVAKLGRSHADVEIAKCEDGFYRYSVGLHYSHGGFCGPITDDDFPYSTYEEAKSAGINELCRRFPKAQPSEPQSVHAELKAMLDQIEQHASQPSLF